MLDLEKTNEFFKLRRLLIEREFHGLNPMQKQAVFAVKGPLLVLAGAGSGKTTVIVNRIANIIKYGCGYESLEIPRGLTEDDIAAMREAYDGNIPLEPRLTGLLADNPCPPWAVMAITFTNKAANELKTRIAARLERDDYNANEVWAATFHSVCVRILRRDIEKLGYDRGFTIYDDDDSKRVIRDIIKRLNLDDKAFPPKSVGAAISNAKENLIYAETYADTYGDDYRARRIGQVFTEYQRILKSANALDFDDIILLTVRLFSEHEDVLNYYRRRFKYILIDEYQDTNKVQYLFASLIAGGHRNLCVVGDDDQSIYSFRGAVIENILSFDKHFDDARVVNLEQNYRSTSRILDAANAVIRNNSARNSKKLWTDKGKGAKVVIFDAVDERDEAGFIADTIRMEVAAGKKLRDFAVLYRLNVLSNQMEQAFKRKGVPYRMYGGTTFYTRGEIKDMLAYLCVIENPSDDGRLKRIINNPSRKIGDRTVEQVEEIARQLSVPMYEVLRNIEKLPELSRARNGVTSFVAIIDTLQSVKEELPLDELYDKLMELSGYAEALVKKGDEESLGRLANINELRSNLSEYMAQNEESSLAGFLEEVSLFTDIDRYDDEADAVVMMTLHSAKGLEFPNVFICGVEEGIFPGLRSMLEPANLEEERRLAYVGITRAKSALYLTHAMTRMLFGATQYNHISRFAEEIPEDCVERLPKKKPQPKRQAGTPNPARYSGLSDLGSLSQRQKSAAPLDFKPGDEVEHRSFGRGFILSAQSMGGDVMLEVAFDQNGTKRLMAKVASSAMRKI